MSNGSALGVGVGDDAGSGEDASKPLCFVLMPFGRKPDQAGMVIDFDAVYGTLIKPAIEAAGLEPLRADEEQAGGFVHKPMYERLLLSEYAVADLTTANANVYYELGIRHATRPRSTVLLFAEGTRLPFDVTPIRGLPYAVDASGRPKNVAETSERLANLLRAARQPSTDSPIFQMLEGFPPPDISRIKTDVFRSRVAYSAKLKDELAEARSVGVEAIRAVAARLRPVRDAESGVVVDLLLSFRAVKAWKDMISLVSEMAEPLSRTIMVREQYALALNRDEQGEKAERVLLDLIKERGPSSETYGILGRVYKDRWERAHRSGETILAAGLLDKAINAYLKGFQADWRDAYPGVNAVTLMELRDPPDDRRQALLPVVTYGVVRRIEGGEPDYWDHATLVELAVLAGNREQALLALGNALALVREVWEPETTLRNLRLLRERRAASGGVPDWMREVEDALDKASHR